MGISCLCSKPANEETLEDCSCDLISMKTIYKNFKKEQKKNVYKII